VSDISDVIDPIKFGLNPERPFTATATGKFGKEIRVQQTYFGGDVTLDITQQPDADGTYWYIGIYPTTPYGDEDLFSTHATSKAIAKTVRRLLAQTAEHYTKLDNRDDLRASVEETERYRAPKTDTINLHASLSKSGKTEAIVIEGW